MHRSVIIYDSVVTTNDPMWENTVVKMKVIQKSSCPLRQLLTGRLAQDAGRVTFRKVLRRGENGCIGENTAQIIFSVKVGKG